MELFIHQKKKTKNTCCEVLIAIVTCYSYGVKNYSGRKWYQSIGLPLSYSSKLSLCSFCVSLTWQGTGKIFMIFPSTRTEWNTYRFTLFRPLLFSLDNVLVIVMWFHRSGQNLRAKLGYDLRDSTANPGTSSVVIYIHGWASISDFISPIADIRYWAFHSEIRLNFHRISDLLIWYKFSRYRINPISSIHNEKQVPYLPQNYPDSNQISDNG
jgi:hypothetical protein